MFLQYCNFEFVRFLKHYGLQGSAAMTLRCGGMHNDHFCRTFCAESSSEKFWKLINISKLLTRVRCLVFLTHSVHSLTKYNLICRLSLFCGQLTALVNEQNQFHPTLSGHHQVGCHQKTLLALVPLSTELYLRMSHNTTSVTNSQQQKSIQECSMNRVCIPIQQQQCTTTST